MKDILIVSIDSPNNLAKELLLPSADRAGIEVRFFPGDKDSSIAKIYNQAIEKTKERFLIFAHHDIIFTPDIVKVIREKPLDVVLGGVGFSMWLGYVWPDQVPPGALQEVDVFDACMLIYDRLQGVYFDESFSGLHMAVEDFCYSARDKGLELCVPHLEGFGHRGAPVHGGNQADSYNYWRGELVKKWEHKFSVVTT